MKSAVMLLPDNFIRFMEVTDSGCWEWTGSKLRGYGQYHPVRGRTVRAHRFAYEVLVGPIPEGLTLDHLCKEKSCVNPSHLEPVDRGENVRRHYDSMETCKSGRHPWSEENTATHHGRRKCRACASESRRKYWDEKGV